MVTESHIAKVSGLLRERGPQTDESICRCCGLSADMLEELLQSPLFVRLADGWVTVRE